MDQHVVDLSHVRRTVIDAVAAGLNDATSLTTKQLNDLSRQIRVGLASGRGHAEPKPSLRKMLVRAAACHLLAAIDHRPLAETAVWTAPAHPGSKAVRAYRRGKYSKPSRQPH